MTEVVLRILAVLLLSITLIVFGFYFTFATDTLQHDWIYLGAGAIALLSGLATLGGAGVMIMKQVREWGPGGLTSDAGIIDNPAPPPSRGGAAARAAAAAAADSGEGEALADA